VNLAGKIRSDFGARGARREGNTKKTVGVFLPVAVYDSRWIRFFAGWIRFFAALDSFFCRLPASQPASQAAKRPAGHLNFWIFDLPPLVGYDMKCYEFTYIRPQALRFK
jgi:hypothetical protein